MDVATHTPRTFGLTSSTRNSILYCWSRLMFSPFLAERVQESGRPMKMPPLNAYHRRLVHNALQSMEGIVTESEDGDSRYKRSTIRKG